MRLVGRVLLVTGTVLLLGAGTGLRAQLTTISGLYASGVDDTGALLGDNADDPHYVVTASSAGSTYTGTSVTVKSSKLGSGWINNTGTARWIDTPKPGGGAGNNPIRPAGTYDYTLTFTMPAGAQLATVSITGTGAVDNTAEILVNGVIVTGQALNGPGSTNSFTLDSTSLYGTGAAFVSGSNSITFRVTNTGNDDTGLFIASLGGTVIVPETFTYLPAAGAIAAYAFIALRRRRHSRAMPR